MNLELPKVIAHRGASAYAPENTLASFKKASEIGASWVEFDVKLTSDDQVIIFHDDTLDRTTDGEGLVVDHSLKAIQELDAGLWFANEFIQESVPTLVETIDVLSDLGLGANVEIKPNPGQEKKTSILTYQLLENKWPKQLPPLLFSSFSRESLLAIRALSDEAQLGLLLADWPNDWIEFAQKLNCISIHVYREILTKEKAECIKQNGFYLLAYTVDNPLCANELFQWGVDSIFSNIPDLFVRSDVLTEEVI